MPKVPPYTSEFRLEAVRLLRSSGRSVPQLAKELGVSPQTLRNWSTQLDIDEGKAEGLSSSEREELRRLRREVKVLSEEREILKKAARRLCAVQALRRHWFRILRCSGRVGGGLGWHDCSRVCGGREGV